MHASSVFLLLPPTADQVSGGNHYNRGLADALASAGGCVVQWADRADAARTVGSTGGTLLVDSVSIASLPSLRDAAGAEARIWVLAHYLAALDAEASDAARRAERALLGHADGFVAPGDFAADRLRRLWPDCPVCRVEPALAWSSGDAHRNRAWAGGGADVESASRSNPTVAPTARVRALCVASLIPCKGVLPLLSALAAQNDFGEGFELHVVGREDFAPDYAERCRELCAREPVLAKLVRLRGVVPHAEMRAEYEAARVLVSAATLETFGMALQEARSVGLPILALAAGNVPAHITDEAVGRLYGTHADLVAGLLGFVREPERLRALSSSARSGRTTPRRTWRDALSELLAGLAQ